ncbi:sigma-54-dependent Fis family transcriptional regulator [Noviherbaspirillum sedimenti]|uniref:Sigma-54-dependent Fis family transcriptional regulator n=2 Tax=Noviherbaspirillum sedimenti TaxID=2320865 RepID=A0A3A3FNQ8_9BURK|nr:sigma-54-dependent Fis family transcriptional regulator [Noviherbaspirillum sedimenti]RJF96456.1 sigma-54-dependent Fis family transcriptional regulator [Noviherbaspirillum sedimenti]RJG00299.1 sigma-54-dependent Fis family transcriptional regulator [Noviherbaspirillum sedimenti]
MIKESRERSVAYGLTESAIPDFSSVSRTDLTLAIEQNRVLHTHALPVMETLYEQIINTHNMVILTDAHGLIVHTLGDDDFLEKANRVALQPGVAWSEQSKGTNAIGTAIAEQAPAQVHANEHYLIANHFLTCSAAPIFDSEGSVIGVLDVTGDQNSFHKHTMGLVRMSAQMIENQVFSAAYQDAITLHFHSRPEFIGTLMEGIAAFTQGGRFLSANRSGLFQLGLPLTALKMHTFSSLFGLPVSALFDHYRTAAPVFLNLCMHSGVRVYARAQLHRANMFFQADQLHPGASERSVPLQAQAAQRVEQQATRRLSSLHYLNTGDVQIAALIDKVNKVLGRDIAILVTGETGTGKELLAQAIHNDSPRANGPFVAVNCASIPETLIESELFGYEDGAFTGARKKGSVGKILQANGGTLFLDEIGDMPLSLQARLLRVLQERMVTPLGSSRSIPVNVALICATHRNLRELIAAGVFREDLYYRLNGLVVKLPPLRERSDLEVVIERLIATEADGTQCTVSAAVMELFKRHNWPGNCRQLTNLLRTAIVMVGDDREIRREHLPDDFLDDIEAVQRGESGRSGPISTQVAVSMPTSATLDDVEISLIQNALAAHGGNISATARALGVSRNKIYRKIPQQ